MSSLIRRLLLSSSLSSSSSKGRGLNPSHFRKRYRAEGSGSGSGSGSVSAVEEGEKLSNDQKVRKIIRSLPKAWEVNATTLMELNDSKEMHFNVFMGNLKTHEMEMKARADKGHQAKASQRRSVALKSSSNKVIVSDESESSSEEDEELMEISNALRKLLLMGKKKKEEKKPVTCYNCKEPDHYSNECLLKKKKVLKATWDDSSEGEAQSEPDTAYMCFMAHSEDEVCFISA